ncbi:MAG: hypothetical protein IPG95_00335 [Saprospiraceae bacterium]|nr:hypothetical protein [Saprospiraceae bacterium]
MIFNRPLLFASPVKDLTIARYLAAVEVDFIGIDLDEADPKKLNTLIKQLNEWIEGPKLIGVSAFPLQLQHLDFGLHGFYADSDLSGFNMECRMHSLEYYKNQKPEHFDFILINQIEQAIQNIPYLLKSSIKKIPESNPSVDGYYFAPGIEEKTGLFDFEEMDTWIEHVKALH